MGGRLKVGSARPRLWVGFAVDLEQLLDGEVGVFLSRGETLVTQQLLDGSEIGTVVE